MSIRKFFVSGYRSIRDLHVPLRRVNVFTGPNGCGKSNLYNALFLLSKASHGGLSQSIADEGGMASVLWAGKRPKGQKNAPVRMTIGVRTERFCYDLSCGLPPPSEKSAFTLDPAVKEEYVWFGERRLPRNTTFERSQSGAWVCDAEGRRISYSGKLLSSESVLSQLREPQIYPELSLLQREFAQWRFYHQFRTDAHSPLRQPQIGVLTPVLSHDGRDLAAALQTILEIGDGQALTDAVADAFHGARLVVMHDQGRFDIAMQIPGLLRPLSGLELSDGTLRYLCLVAALLSPRPSTLLALNEPETSLHPDLLGPLAASVMRASRDSQIWITTHSEHLAGAIAGASGQATTELSLDEGATRIVGQGLILPDE